MTRKKTPNLQNYSSTYKKFKWEIPNKKINAADYVFKHNKIKDTSKKALIWESSSGEEKVYSYKNLEKKTNKFANYLTSSGLKKQDRIFFFLPRVPEVYYGFLAAVKAGGIAGTLFGAFGEQALTERLKNSGARFLVTNQKLGARVEKIKHKLPNLEKIIYTGTDEFNSDLENQADQFKPVLSNPQDPAVMLYTSATGRTPVCGIVLPHQSIICQQKTAEWVLDLHRDDVYWCSADPGWVTGIAYGIFGAWARGATSAVLEGRFNADNWFSFLEKNKINVWYTAPTALRMLKENIKNPKDSYDFSHLRHICSVGEALEPALINWGREKLGLDIHDTYWQTETGSIMLANYRSVTIKPGSMGKPVPGQYAAIIDETGNELDPGTEGDLAFKAGWPSQMVDVWKNKERFQSYFRQGAEFKWFVTGDKAYKDEDGYYFYIGRADDVIKTAGERVGPFEVESALAEHPDVVEAAVIGVPDKMRGEIIKAFLVISNKEEVENESAFKEEIKQFVKKKLAGHAYPREIEIVNSLPKNPSGKIVRRKLK